MFRFSIKQLLRQPGKAILFFLLMTRSFRIDPIYLLSAKDKG